MLCIIISISIIYIIFNYIYCINNLFTILFYYGFINNFIKILIISTSKIQHIIYKLKISMNYSMFIIFFNFYTIFTKTFLAKNDKKLGTNLIKKNLISAQQNIDLNFNVRCLYLENNYTVYDLNPLKHSKDKDESGLYDYQAEVGGNIVTFSFCGDLSENTCSGQETQAGLINSNVCTPLSLKINNGNKWSLTKLNQTNNTGDLIKIALNQENANANKISYILECENDKEKYKNKAFEFIKEKSCISNNEYTLYFKSIYACPKVDYYKLWKFMNDYKVIVSIVLMGFGVTICFFGVYFMKVSIFVFVTFGIVSILTSLLLSLVLTSSSPTWLIWLSFILTLGLGILISYFVNKNQEKLLCLVVAVIGGYFLGTYIFSLAQSKITWHPRFVKVLIILAAGIGLYVVGYFFLNFIVIALLAYVGAYLGIKGLSLLTGRFPAENIVQDLAASGETEQLKMIVSWHLFLYLFFILLLTGAGIFVQFWLKKGNLNKGKGEGDEEREPLNKSE